MQLPNRQRLAVTLMLFSLGLLLLFLGWFVRKIYTDELAALKRESSLLFVNSVRGIEGEFFDKLIVHGANIEQEHMRTGPALPPVPPHRDALQVITYIQKRTLRPGNLEDDTTLRLRISNEKPLTGNPDMRGALSVIVAMNDERLISDSLPGRPMDTARIFGLLEQNFSQAVQNAGLPVHFRLLRLPADSVLNRYEFIAGSYTDLANGEQYSAALSNYRPYLFRQLLPQLLFALLLFVSVLLAFFFIFQTLRRQQRLTDQKDDFVRNMTHELKTPIATVSVAVEALQNFDALEDRTRTAEYLQIARLELSRLALLVDKVLRLSLFEQKAPVFQWERLDFRILIENVLQSMYLQSEQAGAQMDFSSYGQDFILRGDTLHLSSVVYNLLDNALKYSPLSPKITISLVQQTGQLLLEVTDQGRGIPIIYQRKIFERFFRVPTGDLHNVKGHGLGLSYVAEVVKQHGGHIQVASQPGAGARFTVVLPQT